MSARWPETPDFAPLRDGAVVEVGGVPYHLSVVDCGELVMPSGRLAACDPFVTLDAPLVCAQVASGRYPVKVTLADVSGRNDGSHVREAYASILFDAGAAEVRRAPLRPLDSDDDSPLAPGEFFGFGVDAGTACFVDAQAAVEAMPSPDSDWHDDLFDHDGDDAWFNRMDDPAHIRAGLANIELPRAKAGENLILFHSGWGDGVYPVVGGYDADGRLVAAHIDLFVVSGGED